MPSSVVVSPDGSKVFVTGWGWQNGQESPTSSATIAYDTVTGAKLWVARNGPLTPRTVTTSPDSSSLFVAGGSDQEDGVIFAYDASSGRMRWKDPFQGAVSSAIVSPDGARLFVTGHTWGRLNFLTEAYDASTGARLWKSQLARPRQYAQAFSIAVSPDGSKVFASGEGGRVGVSRMMTVAYSASTGAHLWVARSGPHFETGSGDFSGAHVATGLNGTRVFVSGTRGIGHHGTMVTQAYDASTGVMEWTRHYRGPAQNAWATDLKISPDGSTVFVLGGAENPGGGAHVTAIAYGAGDGARLWVTHTAGIDTEAYSMAVAPNGSAIVVTGTTYDYGEGGTYNYLTVAYEQSTGAALWQATYDATRNDEHATRVAVAPDSTHVFVTGVSGPAYATISYRLQ
jgi:hypothetical protein